jgi:hypothetical protein
MTNPLHDAAMAAKRFHDAALAYLDDKTLLNERALQRRHVELLAATRSYSAQTAVNVIMEKYPKTWERLGPE